MPVFSLVSPPGPPRSWTTSFSSAIAVWRSLSRCEPRKWALGFLVIVCVATRVRIVGAGVLTIWFDNNLVCVVILILMPLIYVRRVSDRNIINPLLYICCRKSCTQLVTAVTPHGPTVRKLLYTCAASSRVQLDFLLHHQDKHAYHGVQTTTAQGFVFITDFAVPYRVMILHVFPQTTCEAIPDRSNDVHHLS